MSESYGRRGYAEPGYAERGYNERGYDERGNDQRGYDEFWNDQRGYRERGHNERGYDERAPGRDGQKSTRSGGVLLAAISLFSTFMVLWGLYYATGTGARHKVALAAAQCEPNLLSNNFPCGTVGTENVWYEKLVNPIIQQMNADVADYTVNERHDLTAAQAALRAEVTLENGFASSLARFPFPPFIAPITRTLIRDIQAQAKLTAQQAGSPTLRRMRSFDGLVGAAGAAVRTELGLVRKTLTAPVTPNEEP
jgi:hypothetical protein